MSGFRTVSPLLVLLATCVGCSSLTPHHARMGRSAAVGVARITDGRLHAGRAPARMARSVEGVAYLRNHLGRNPQPAAGPESVSQADTTHLLAAAADRSSAAPPSEATAHSGELAGDEFERTVLAAAAPSAGAAAEQLVFVPPPAPPVEDLPPAPDAEPINLPAPGLLPPETSPPRPKSASPAEPTRDIAPPYPKAEAPPATVAPVVPPPPVEEWPAGDGRSSATTPPVQGTMPEPTGSPRRHFPGSCCLKLLKRLRR